MPIVNLQDGIHFTLESGETILDAADRAGINIGYACRTGRCSTCKCRDLGRSTKPLYPELGLLEQELLDGWILSCVRTADTDVTLIANELISFSLPHKQTLPCKIDHLTHLAPDILEVTLRLPPSAAFNFRAGQYVDVIGPSSVRRSYSLASGSSAQRLVLHVRRVQGGALSEYWFGKAKTGDLLRLFGPLGTFFLRGIEGKRLVFLATGTGIAPVTAMLEDLARSNVAFPKDVTVFWGGRKIADFYKDIGQMDIVNNYQPVLSRPASDWTGRLGYIQDALIAENYDLKNTVVYACGSDEMIRSAKSVLTAAGLNPHDFFSDAFVCSAAF